MSVSEKTHAETIADIVAEMRRGTKLPGYWHSCDVNKILQYHADRIEAAHKRDIEDAERRGNHAATKAICETIEKVGPLYDAESIGDAAKLREAVEKVIEIANKEWDASRETSAMWEIWEICKAALAAPPRNCDVGTAEEQEKRFHDFCRARHLPRMEVSSYCAYKCPLEGDTCCELQWAQMPYEEKEGGAK